MTVPPTAHAGRHKRGTLPEWCICVPFVRVPLCLCLQWMAQACSVFDYSEFSAGVIADSSAAASDS